MNIDFSSDKLYNVSFIGTTFNNADFTLANIDSTNFNEAKLNDVIFSSGQLFNVQYSSAKFLNAKFLSAELHTINFAFVHIEYSNFSSTTLASTDFNEAQMSGTDLRRTTCVAARFDYANLSQSNFGGANVKRTSFHKTDLTNVNFSDTNLYKSNFTETKITDSQLKSTLSIQDALLPNGTLAHDSNLIKNGQADCNISLLDSWKLQSGDVSTMTSEEDRTDCQFALQSFAAGASMSQRVTLPKKWESNSWPYSHAVLNANMGVGVTIQLRGINSSDQISAQQMFNWTQESISLYLLNDMRELEVLIEFSAIANQNNKASSWCDDIQLIIVYGTFLEFLRGTYLARHGLNTGELTYTRDT
ncbi:unnamed protein product [Rotaria magnacalcarata]|uniref:Pentapeptide repeat-containing protein n=1 Tax=Rotaria magnacalcarata TaxID=392030 RepID=A0A819EQN2_9BILA|nr:unnamed protein product [Rotaria magnacalcarata]CAF4012455.1 unnamed protein product [Rotaria magnacalcarata]